MTHHSVPQRAHRRRDRAPSRARVPRVLALAAALTLPACAAAAGDQEPTDIQAIRSGPYSEYPDSLAVVGHSQATGENTVPYENGDTKSNTWASGTNPAVRSVYQRILDVHPPIAGQVTNAAQPGAPIAAIEEQAMSVAGSRPDLLLVQAIDGDLACPATQTDVRNYGAAVASLLDSVAKASPSTRVFFVSQYGSPRTFVESLSPEQRGALGADMGSGPCAFLDADGELVPKEVNRLERIIRDYERIQAQVCDQHENCSHDAGAFSKVVDQPGDFTDDFSHLSIQGHASAAELAWHALQDAGLIPSQ
jgi:hypothetical protein